MLLPITFNKRGENLYSLRKLTNKSENILILTGNAWTSLSFNASIVNNVSSYNSPRISDQSSTIHSNSLHTDNNYTAWWRYKICICLVILGELEGFWNYKGFSIISRKCRCNLTYYAGENFSDSSLHRKF